MCGVAGLFHLDGHPVELARIKRMTDAMRHRGPDDEGFVAFSSGPTVRSHLELTGEDIRAGLLDAAHNFLLGHRRLSIIDLSRAGHQPMANEDLTVWISYNGEIYNFRQLRAGLERRGHTFRSRTDSEVILHLYEEKGDAFVHDLDGVFAFALWDDRRKRLLVVRDRMGVKPLYWLNDGRRFAFASEIKALVQAGLLTPAVHAPALAEYFTFQNTFGRETLFRDVNILLPGTMLVLEGKRVAERRWWQPRVEAGGGRSGGGLAASARRLRAALERTVEDQLVSDVPVGSYLSGGIDSGSIVALATRHVPRLATFTCGFDLAGVTGLELVFDERASAEQIASRYHTSHYEMVLHAGDMAWMLPRLVKYEEELRLGMSYQNHYAARLAGKFVRVVLGGSGGDELFAGYPWRYAPAAACRSRRQFDDVYYRTWQRLVPEAEHAAFFTTATRRAIGDYSPRDSFRAVFAPEDPVDDWLHRALLFDLRTFLHGLLTIEDKIHMSYSVELRVPLLGHRLIDLALAIPAAQKLDGETGKAVFRRAVGDLLPEEILGAKKQGFSPPDRSWYQGPTMRYIRDILGCKRARERGFFDQRYVDRIVEEHTGGAVNHRLLIWSLLCFEWWNRIWVDGEAVE